MRHFSFHSLCHIWQSFSSVQMSVGLDWMNVAGCLLTAFFCGLNSDCWPRWMGLRFRVPLN